MKRFLLPIGIGVGSALGLVSCASDSEFCRADVNGDQELTIEEIENRLVEAIFEKADKNRDGRVTSAEWSVVNPNTPVVHFYSRDTNKDEVIELQEFQDYVDETKMFDQALAKLDPSGDGCVSCLESEEILKAVSQ